MQAIKQKTSLVKETYYALVDAICSGELAPGARLNQDELAARLNVSRQPVNSAISILKSNDLVRDNGRRGAIVSHIDPRIFRSIYEYRSVIEPFCVMLAGERMPKNARAEAERVLGRGEHALESRNMLELIRADVKFHEMIYRWSGNKVIEHSMELNWHHTRRFMAEIVRDPGQAMKSWEEHREIIVFLFNNDAKAAAEKMRSHIERAYEELLPQLTAIESISRITNDIE